MSGAETSFVSARFLLPFYIVRAEDNTLSCPLWQDGVLVAPVSGTGTVYDQTGSEVYSATVTVSGSIASITVPASSIPSTMTPSSRWRVEYDLTLSDGSIIHARNKAHLVLTELVPTVTDADLFRRQSALDPSGSAPISSLTTYQPYIDEAWVSLVSRITGQGPLPYLVTEPTSFREAHVCLTLAMIYEDFSSRLNESFSEKADMYRDRYEAAWQGLRFEYDEDQDGRSDGPAKRAAVSTWWLTGRG